MAQPDIPAAFGAEIPARMGGLLAQPAVRRAAPWIVGAGGLALAGAAWFAIAPAPQRVLYGNLGDSEKATVVAALEKAGIGYQLDGDSGALTVNEDDLYRARMVVSADGALAAPETGTDLLTTMPLGASRTLEGDRIRAARERDLVLTIMEIDGVEGARVHLAEPRQSMFVRDESPPTASVMVRLATGRSLSQSQVAAIVNLVAGSIPGLAADAVRVVDQHGRLLSADKPDGFDGVGLQARIEDKLRSQLDQLLVPMLGEGNFSSEVQVELDRSEVTSAREAYDKQGAIRSETQSQTQTAGSSPAAGIPGALSNTPPPAVTASPGPPQPAAAATAAPAQGVGETSATRNYELGREVSVASTSPGTVKRISVAVAISQAAFAKGRPADVEAIKQVVSAAVGADTRRGDQVAVVVRPFQPVTIDKPAFYETPLFATLLRSAAALLTVVLVLFFAVRPLLKAARKMASPPEIAADSDMPEVSPAAATDEAGASQLAQQISLAQQVVEQRPDNALLALRRMLAESNREAA